MLGLFRNQLKDVRGASFVVLKMPGTEVKQRKKTPKQNNQELSGASSVKGEDEKEKSEDHCIADKPPFGPDMKSLMCLLSLVACGVLSW